MSIEQSDKAAASVATAPRVSLADIESKIAARYDFTASAALNALEMPATDETKLLSICILVMQNGWTVIGKSACAAPENFNAELGRKFAYEDAIRQVWPLEGYLLRETLSLDKTGVRRALRVKDTAEITQKWDETIASAPPAKLEPGRGMLVHTQRASVPCGKGTPEQDRVICLNEKAIRHVFDQNDPGVYVGHVKKGDTGLPFDLFVTVSSKCAAGDEPHVFENVQLIVFPDPEVAA